MVKEEYKLYTMSFLRLLFAASTIQRKIRKLGKEQFANYTYSYSRHKKYHQLNRIQHMDTVQQDRLQKIKYTQAKEIWEGLRVEEKTYLTLGRRRKNNN
jgi:hypothetical protein